LLLGPYLLFHLWQNSALLSGREAWLERALRIEALFGFELTFLFCLSLALHAALGWGKGRGPGALQPGTPGLQRLQQITGLAVLLFLCLHLYQVWLYERGGRLLCNGPYEALRTALGSPLQAAIYAAAVTAVYFHFAHGLSRAAVFWGLVRDERQLRAARYLAGAFGFILWVLTLHMLGRFVVGQGLFG
jgi:succinate dehydrogenase/fumarate reductase cytochrome b subunit